MSTVPRRGGHEGRPNESRSTSCHGAASARSQPEPHLSRKTGPRHASPLAATRRVVVARRRGQPTRRAIDDSVDSAHLPWPRQARGPYSPRASERLIVAGIGGGDLIGVAPARGLCRVARRELPWGEGG